MQHFNVAGWYIGEDKDGNKITIFITEYFSFYCFRELPVEENVLISSASYILSIVKGGRVINNSGDSIEDIIIFNSNLFRFHEGK